MERMEGTGRDDRIEGLELEGMVTDGKIWAVMMKGWKGRKGMRRDVNDGNG